MAKYWICFELNDYAVATKEEFEKKVNDYAMEYSRLGEIEVDDMTHATWYMQNDEVIAWIEK